LHSFGLVVGLANFVDAIIYERRNNNQKRECAAETNDQKKNDNQDGYKRINDGLVIQDIFFPMVHTLAIVGAINIRIHVVNIHEFDGQQEKQINTVYDKLAAVWDKLGLAGYVFDGVYDNIKGGNNDEKHFEIFQCG